MIKKLIVATLALAAGPTSAQVPWLADYTPELEIVPPSVERTADTLRYTLMPAGIRAGERSVWFEAPNVRHHHMSYGGAGLESRLELDSAGLPVRIETTGVLQTGLPWEERFERRGETATWSTPDDRDTRAVAGPAYYVSPGYEAAFDLSLLSPALLARADRSLRLLPEGTARLEPLGLRTVEAEGRSREVGHFAVHGLDLAPEYVWLDEDGSLFADEVSIRAGWEAAFSELLAASREAVIEHGRSLFDDLIPPARERPLVIRGARLFDAESRSTREGTTIVVRENRVAAVGPDGSVEVPDGAEVIEAAGRTVLPGLWDMHVHTSASLDEELEAPLYVAGGVTTVRDLGSATDVLTSLRRRGDAAEAIVPRVLPALILYGPGGRVLGASVDSPEEAREAIDRFAELDYVQVKLRQPSLAPELVPVVVEHARRHGMRVSGHVLDGMTGREAIESGYDEIQHMLYVRVGAAGIRSLASDEDIGARMAAVRPGTDEWREFVRLLLAHDVAVDPTLAVVEESVGGRPPVWLGEVPHRLPPQVRRKARYNAGPQAPPPPVREHWDEMVANGPAMLRALHVAGVPLVAGTDADFGGFPLHRELELYVEAGIPAPEVLAIATLGAARAMGMDDELGSIETGKLADLVLVDGNPTADISDIRRVVTVVKDGRIYDPAAIYRALGIEPCCATEAPSPAPVTVGQDRFVLIDGARIHYLDFGGEGLPILFLHAGALSASTYSELAPRFADAHRVLAMTERGVSPSTGERADQVVRGQDVIALLDSLGIERAVVIGDSSPTEVLIYLAEHHADRLAGLVFLAGSPEPILTGPDDPLRVQEMGMRLMSSVQGLDPERYVANAERLAYRPEYLDGGGRIDLPALTFVGSEGDKGVEGLGEAMITLGQQVASGAIAVPDSLAREYFTRLGRDQAFQARVEDYYRDFATPAWRASEQAFRAAFGDRLSFARLEVPTVTGHEYRDQPGLIEPEIRRFLEGLERGQAEGSGVPDEAAGSERSTLDADSSAAGQAPGPGTSRR